MRPTGDPLQCRGKEEIVEDSLSFPLTLSLSLSRTVQAKRASTSVLESAIHKREKITGRILRENNFEKDAGNGSIKAGTIYSSISCSDAA